MAAWTRVLTVVTGWVLAGVAPSAWALSLGAAGRSEGVPLALVVMIALVSAACGAWLTRRLVVDAALRQRAQALEAQLRTFNDIALDYSLVTLDARGTVLAWNRGAQHVEGHAPEQIIGQPWDCLFPAEDREQGVPQQLLAAALREGSTAVEGWRMRADGGRFWSVGSLYRLPASMAVGDDRFALISRDMTQAREAVHRLAESQARLALALDGARMGIWHWDIASQTSRWNAREYELLGLPPGDGLVEAGLFYRQVHPDDLAPLQQAVAEALDGGGEFRHEFRVLVEGELRWVGGAGRAQLDASGRAVALAGINFDITEQRQAEQALRESETRLHAVITSASDAIISTDVNGTIQLFNPAAERIFGHPAAGMLGQSLERLLPRRERGRHALQMAAFAETAVTQRGMGAGTVEGQHADGHRIELEASISQASVGGRRVLTAILRDVTDRARADRALVQYQLELAGLAQRLFAQEKETTQRLAQTLHDELGQTLGALRLTHDALRLAPAPPPALLPLLEREDRLITDANRQVRQVLSELRSPLLDEQGLVAALDNELQRLGSPQDDTRLVLEVAPGLQAQRWPSEVEYAVFMVAREAVANALRHARAASVGVALAGDARRLQLQVRDDGIGLPPERRAGRPGHLGLVGMRERALSITGTLTLGAAPGAGTTIQLTWQMPDDPPLAGA